ncbi:MAG: hypothetical protein PWP26_1244, partial [Thermodesulfobacterium sp.]|nr:hypothetical protein [Thermodesulfobacterium sp.]
GNHRSPGFRRTLDLP